MKKTFDINLGWDWKPKSKHQEKIFSKINKISFGKFGERNGAKLKKKNHIEFASFGDSFVFCRYVKIVKLGKKNNQENLYYWTEFRCW